MDPTKKRTNDHSVTNAAVSKEEVRARERPALRNRPDNVHQIIHPSKRTQPTQTKPRQKKQTNPWCSAPPKRPPIERGD